MTHHAQLCYRHFDPASQSIQPALQSYADLSNPPQVIISKGIVTIYVATDVFFFTLDTFINMVVEEEQSEQRAG